MPLSITSTVTTGLRTVFCFSRRVGIIWFTHVPCLCLPFLLCLRHSPTVVAGSSMDRRCPGTIGLMYCVRKDNEEAQPSPSPSAPRWEPGALTYVRKCTARYLMKSSLPRR